MVERENIIRPGSTVTIEGGVSGIVNRATIGVTGVTYEVAWWAGRERKEHWFLPHEIRDYQNVMKIGFVEQKGNE